MHGALVVGQTEAAQKRQPLRIVPFGRVRQLTQLRVAWDDAALRSDPAVPIAELVGEDQRTQDARARVARGQRTHVVSPAARIRGPSEQELVGEIHEPLIVTEGSQRPLLLVRVAAGVAVFVQCIVQQPELGRRQ